MRYVLDSSVAFKWFVAEAGSEKALRLHDDFLDLLSPDVFPVEVTHALTRAERQGRITPGQGAQLFTDLLQTLPALVPSLPSLPRAYELSSLLRIGVYDSLYIALAEREGCDLVTADQRLASLSGQPVIALTSL